MTKIKRTILILAVCLTLALAAAASILLVGSEKRNADLRSKYPLIKESDYQIDDAELDFNERVALAPFIEKIEVVEQLPNYTVHIENKEIGLSTDIEFCQYKVKLIDNISDESVSTDSDGTFIITYAKDLEDSYPDFTDGTTAICSLEAASGAHTGKYLLFDKSFYYTDSQLALAAYAGDDSPAKRICSEEKLVNKIRSIRDKR